MGQIVQFMDRRDRQMHTRTIVSMKDTLLTIQEQGTRSAWNLPYTAIDSPTPGAQRAASLMAHLASRPPAEFFVLPAHPLEKCRPNTEATPVSSCLISTPQQSLS